MNEAARHLVVIMARGDSRRMGQAKGLCRQAGDERPLVVRIVELYRRRGWPILVVVRREDEPGYAEALAGHQAQLLVCPRGGDTARTLHHALIWREEHTPGATHLWAHPVDLPAVKPSTIDALLAALEPSQEGALRPSRSGTPGHPVVLSVASLAPLLAEDPGEISMNEFWRRANRKPMMLLPMADSGVVQDCDAPEDLQEPGKKEDPA